MRFEPALRRETLAAMGTLCEVAVTAAEPEAPLASRAIAAAWAEVAACQRALSRFDPDSELGRLNAAAGSWVEVGERLAAALRFAIAAREETGGLFDPTILPALAAAGYDQSFELLEERPPAGPVPAGAEIELDGGLARIPPGAGVDLGGLGKGFAADRAIEAMRAAWPGARGGLADLGGDIALWGETPEGGPWRLRVADPKEPDRTVAVLELEHGGVATSGRDTRRFGPDRSLHHLIDPATGAPAAAGPLAVTVVAPDAAAAEIASTALAVQPVAAAAGFLESRPDLGAVLVPDGGELVVLGSLPLAAEAIR